MCVFRMVKLYLVTTKVGKREFRETFRSVAFVDRYLAGARALKKQHPKAPKAKIKIQTKDTVKETLSKGRVLHI